jgi:hypothetical protein
MFQPIGFRHALATAQLLFYLAVMIPYEYQLYELRHPVAGNRNDVGWDPSEFGPPEWVQACAIVNAPAVIVFGGLERFVPARLSWIIVAFIAAGVFLQWYLVGLWRDRSAGLTSRESTTQSSRVGLIFVWIGLVVAGVSALLAIAAQVFYFESSNSFLISLTIWCGFFAAFLLAQLRGRGTTDSGGSTLKI